jgi:two-component system response regulator AtoC
LVSLKEIEKKYIQHALKASKRNKTQTCRILKISRPTLDKKIKEYNLES